MTDRMDRRAEAAVLAAKAREAIAKRIAELVPTVEDEATSAIVLRLAEARGSGGEAFEGQGRIEGREASDADSRAPGISARKRPHQSCGSPSGAHPVLRRETTRVGPPLRPRVEDVSCRGHIPPVP